MFRGHGGRHLTCYRHLTHRVPIIGCIRSLFCFYRTLVIAIKQQGRVSAGMVDRTYASLSAKLPLVHFTDLRLNLHELLHYRIPYRSGRFEL